MRAASPGPVTTIAILGGGTAGWMTAAALLHRLGRLGIQVTLIESSQIGTIGVGEATVPAIKRYFESLQLDAFEVMRATNGTVKLGIEFDGWKHKGHHFMHPFGRYGIQAGPVAFHHLWNRLCAAGETSPIDDYSLGTQLARAGRVVMPNPEARHDFEVFDWALHFDAGRFARYLRQFCEARGVGRVDARLSEVRRHPESGHIAGLQLDNGTTIKAQLYIDCSGFHRLLIERALAVGWAWRIPLQHRIGNGYVYSSDHISDAAAEAALRGELEGDSLAEPNLVRCRAGHVRKFWVGNCVAIGLSAGFLEPLESTSISLIQMGIDKLIHCWPDAGMAPELADEYNRLSIQEYQRIRDFIILHYAANGREGEELWQYCRNMPLPDSLNHKLALYRARGLIVQYESESFFDSSWVCMYANLGIGARDWDPLAGLLDLEELKELTRRLRADIANLANEGSPHREFLRLRGALAAP